MNILFLNSKHVQCGIYQYGKRVCDILKNTENVNYMYHELNSVKEYYKVLNDTLKQNIILHCIVYNYHGNTMEWLNSNVIQKRIKNIGIYHEGPIYSNTFNYVIDIKNVEKTKYIPRPIYENIEEIVNNPINSNDFIKSYQDSGIPIFGSFGFGFNSKGFEKIVQLINMQYDNAIIKLVIPIAHFDISPQTNTIIEKCKKNNIKSGIILLITTDFFTNEQIVTFLHSNTMNIFMYDILNGKGLSSSIDYALSAKKPIGISNSDMFKHIYRDDICIYNVSVEECMNNYAKYSDELLEKNSNERLRTKFLEICK